jgi:hypothetical protein
MIFLFISGSPWQVYVTDPKSISVVGSGIDFIVVNRKANFVVNCGENMSENINVSITGNHSNEIENHQSVRTPTSLSFQFCSYRQCIIVSLCVIIILFFP